MRNLLALMGVLVFFLCMRMLSEDALAGTGAAYELVWTSIDAGGELLTGGETSLFSTIAQPEAGATQSGGSYSLNGGVVDAGAADGDAQPMQQVYLPLVAR